MTKTFNEMSILEKIKKRIINEINATLKKKAASIADLEYPPNSELGDLSLPCFQLAKKVGQNPAKVARDLSANYEPLKEIVKGLSAAGAYLNIKLRGDILAKHLIGELKKQGRAYGKNNSGQGKRAVLEYSNANTHKEFHIGHLRNIVYGDAINRILNANGYKSIPVSYINDFGIHIAKTLWAYLEYYKDQEIPKNKGEFLGKVYVRAAKEMAKSKTAKQMVEGIMKKIESKSSEEYKLWQKTRQWSIEQMDQIYSELGVKFEHTFYESEYIDEGRKIISRLVKKNILKESEGAIIADFKKYDLGVVVAIRSNGTALYLVADLALAKAKQDKLKPDMSIYVVDIRQSLYFQQLFKILELIGYKQKMIHLGYDFVKLPSGMMSSRSGNVVTYEELKSEMVKKAEAETKKRHAGWPANKISGTAEKIALGAMKFEMIKVGARQEITFNIEKALEFSGYTAAYLQYTYARINSVIEKSGTKPAFGQSRKWSLLAEPKEHELIIKLAKFGEAVSRAGKEFNPSEIAKYLFELAQLFNDYYHSVPVIKADAEIRQIRLELLLAVKQVIANGLALLGIETIEKM